MSTDKPVVLPDLRVVLEQLRLEPCRPQPQAIMSTSSQSRKSSAPVKVPPNTNESQDDGGEGEGDKSDAEMSGSESGKSQSGGPSADTQILSNVAGIDIIPYTNDPAETRMWPKMRRMDLKKHKDVASRLRTINKKCKQSEVRRYHKDSVFPYSGRSVNIPEWGVDKIIDTGIIPDYLKLLVDQSPEKSKEQILKKFTTDLDDTTHAQMKVACDELGRFNHFLLGLQPTERFFYSLDGGRTNQLPCVRVDGYWVVCCVPYAPMIRMDSYLSNDYLVNRFPQLALMYEHNCLLTAVPDGFDGFVVGQKIFPLDPRNIPDPKKAVETLNVSRSQKTIELDEPETIENDPKKVPEKVPEAAKKNSGGNKRPLMKNEGVEEDKSSTTSSQAKRSRSSVGGSKARESVGSPRLSHSTPVTSSEMARLQKLEKRLEGGPTTPVIPVVEAQQPLSGDQQMESASLASEKQSDQEPMDHMSSKVVDTESDDDGLNLNQQIDPDRTARWKSQLRVPQHTPTRDKAISSPKSGESESDDSEDDNRPSRPVSKRPLNFATCSASEPLANEARVEEELDIGVGADMSEEETVPIEAESLCVPVEMKVELPGSSATAKSQESDVSKPEPHVVAKRPVVYAVPFHRLHAEIRRFAYGPDADKLKAAIPPYFVPEKSRPPIYLDRTTLGTIHTPMWYKSFSWYCLGTSQGLYPTAFGMWTPAGCIDQLDALIARTVDTRERQVIRPGDLMTVKTDLPYFNTPRELQEDHIHKSGLQMYEHFPTWVEAALSAPANLHNVTRHMGHQCTILRGCYTGQSDDPRFIPIPSYRTLDSLIQIYLCFGSPAEQMAVRHYLYDKLKDYRDKGSPEGYFSTETPEARKKANELWATLSTPPRNCLEHPVSILRLMIVPYVVQCHSTTYLMANPSYSTMNVYGGPDNWNPPERVITPMYDADNLLTADNSLLSMSVTNLNSPNYEYLKPPLLIGISQIEAEGTPREIINRSDRPDFVPRAMRARTKYLNTIGEAVGNAYGSVKLGLENTLEWETFQLRPLPSNRDPHRRSKRLQQDTVYIGGRMARELAEMSGSSYFGKDKMNIKEMLIAVLMLNAPLWKKNCTRTSYAVLVPDDSQIYMDEGLIEIPSLLNKVQKDQMLVAANIFAIHVAEVLRALGIVPVFLEKLPRVQRYGSATWREAEFLQRASCWYFSKVIEVTRFPLVTLQDLWANCYNVEGYFGPSEDHIKYGTGRDGELIVTRIDDMLASQEVSEFWTTAHQAKLFCAAEFKREALAPFEWFKEFLPCITDTSKKSQVGDDIQLHLHWTGSLKHLKRAIRTADNPKDSQMWKLKKLWVLKFISNLSFHLNGVTYDTPENVTGNWPLCRGDLNMQNDSDGVEILKLTREQNRTFQRAINVIWSAAHPTLHFSQADPYMSHNQKTLCDMSTLDEELIPKEYEGRELESIHDEDRLEWYRRHPHPRVVPVSVAPIPVVPAAAAVVPSNSAAPSPSGSRSVTPVEQPINYSDSEVKQMLVDWLRSQDELDPINNPILSPDEVRFKNQMAQWWIRNLNEVPDNETTAMLSRDAIRRLRRSSFYSLAFQDVLFEYRQNPAYRGFYAANPILENIPATSPTVPALLPIQPSNYLKLDSSGQFSPQPGTTSVVPDFSNIPVGKGRGTSSPLLYPPATAGTSTSPGVSTPRSYSSGSYRPNRDVNWGNKGSMIFTSSRQFQSQDRFSTTKVLRQPIPLAPTLSTLPPQTTPNLDKRVESLQADLERTANPSKFDDRVLNYPTPYGRPPPRAGLLPSPTSPDPQKSIEPQRVVSVRELSELDTINQIVMDSRLDYTRAQVEAAVNGGELLRYPLGRYLTNPRILVYCEPPATDKTMGDDYKTPIVTLIEAEMFTPNRDEWDLALVRGIIIKWMVRRERHTTGEMTISQEVMKNILKVTEERYMVKMFPSKYNEMLANQPCLCQ